MAAAVSTSQGPSVKVPNGVAKSAAAAAPLVDLLDLSSDDVPAAPSSSGGDFLQDLLGVDLSPATSLPGLFCRATSMHLHTSCQSFSYIRNWL